MEPIEQRYPETGQRRNVKVRGTGEEKLPAEDIAPVNTALQCRRIVSANGIGINPGLEYLHRSVPVAIGQRIADSAIVILELRPGPFGQLHPLLLGRRMRDLLSVRPHPHPRSIRHS